MFVFLVWGILAFFGATIEQSYVGSSDAGVFNTIMNAPIFTSHNVLVGAVSTIFDGAMWGALLRMFLFDFAFFTGAGGQFIRFALFIPIGASIVASMALGNRGS